jgi:AmiR/NasT family two-component response regulator
MPEADVLRARALADLATLTVLQQRAGAETQRVNEQLTHALAGRTVIEQAKGVIFARVGVEMAEAFTMLRAYSRNHNIRLTAVARGAIDGTIDPRPWATRAPR